MNLVVSGDSPLCFLDPFSLFHHQRLRSDKMRPYFHTSGGDNLFFESWTPLSPGAIAGASVAIFFLAVLERFVNGVRGRLEGYWTSK